MNLEEVSVWLSAGVGVFLVENFFNFFLGIVFLLSFCGDKEGLNTCCSLSCFMRELRFNLDEEDYQELMKKKAKESLTWRDLLLWHIRRRN